MSGRRISKSSIFRALRRHLPSDVRLDETHFGGYTPTPGVFGPRLWGALEPQVERIGRGIRSDFYMDGRYMGFRDNRDPVAYDKAARRLVRRLRAFGLKVRTAERNGLIWSMEVQMPADLVKAAEAQHGAYVTQLDQAKSRTRRRR